MRTTPIALLIGVWLVAPRLGIAQQPNDPLSVADRRVIASRLYATVQQYFAHWEGAPRSAVDSAYQVYLGQALAANSRREFDLATMRFVAALHNGHTRFLDSQLDARPLKFRLLRVEGAWAVISSSDSRLKPGSVVRAIDGVPADSFVRVNAAYVAASNERLAETHVFSYPALFPERVSLTLAGGDTITIDRSVSADAPLIADTVSSGSLLQPDLAYIKVPSFGDPRYERRAVELVREFRRQRTILIDVRGNGGGTTPRPLIAALMNRPWRTWQSQVQSPDSDAYSGTVIILVNRFCGSACEDFVMPFKDTHRATIVGETTQGSSGNPFRTEIGPEMRLEVGAVRYRFPDGSIFEGVGIAPDVVVERRLADIIAGRDAILIRARELAGRASERGR